VIYEFAKVLLSPLLHVFFRIRVSGAENIPATGPVIIAANHQAFCDSLFIPLVVPRKVTFVAKADYFKSWKTRWFFRAMGQIPMERSGGKASMHSLSEAYELLERGGVLGIYPEGTRSPDERLHRGRTGVARLIVASQCLVVPVGVRGTRDIQPIGKKMLRLFRTVDIRIGEPIDFCARYGDRLSDRLVLRQITDDLMFEISELSGQAYVDRYASRSPAGASTQTRVAGPAGGAASPAA
jgi:1-acyl-sn-glycerol-3-phosphate acyltransferase